MGDADRGDLTEEVAAADRDVDPAGAWDEGPAGFPLEDLPRRPGA
jgi:hypothetical protein